LWTVRVRARSRGDAQRAATAHEEATAVAVRAVVGAAVGPRFARGLVETLARQAFVRRRARYFGRALRVSALDEAGAAVALGTTGNDAARVFRAAGAIGVRATVGTCVVGDGERIGARATAKGEDEDAKSAPRF
jgi:hypothetical protein